MLHVLGQFLLQQRLQLLELQALLSHFLSVSVENPIGCVSVCVCVV
jgi:hypothetical protein